MPFQHRCHGHRCECGSYARYVDREPGAISECRDIGTLQLVCTERHIVTCPFCTPDHWGESQILNTFEPQQLEGSRPETWPSTRPLPESSSRFIGPPRPVVVECRCQACGY